MRLDKYLAEACGGTRKMIREQVKEGWVTVNHQMVTEPATEIDETKDVIRYLGKEIIHTGKVYYMFHKPAGCITATKDACNTTVLDYFEEAITTGLFPVGRLDKDTEGLLLLTNDGEFSHRLMHPEKHVEKTYFFWAFGCLEPETRERLQAGVSIGEQEALAKAIRVEITEEGYYEELKGKLDPEKVKDIRKTPNQKVVAGYLTISEGRKHQVKRMLKAVGCYVVYLKRISIGEVMLDETLEPGQYRELSEEERKRLYQ
jgi:16S rRNA pseudouridine516 synthase